MRKREKDLKRTRLRKDKLPETMLHPGSAVTQRTGPKDGTPRTGTEGRIGVKFHSKMWYLNRISMRMIQTSPHFSDSFVIKMMNQSLDFIIPTLLENEPENEHSRFFQENPIIRPIITDLSAYVTEKTR